MLRSYTFANEAAPAQVHIVPALSAYSLNATRRQEVKGRCSWRFHRSRVVAQARPAKALKG